MKSPFRDLKWEFSLYYISYFQIRYVQASVKAKAKQNHFFVCYIFRLDLCTLLWILKFLLKSVIMGLVSSAMKEGMEENLKKQQDFMLQTQQMQVHPIFI